jgi:hypothetical protein
MLRISSQKRPLATELLKMPFFQSGDKEKKEPLVIPKEQI